MTLGYAVLYEVPFYGGPLREIARTPWFGGRRVKFTVDRRCTASAWQVGSFPVIPFSPPRELEAGWSIEFTMSLEST